MTLQHQILQPGDTEAWRGSGVCVVVNDVARTCADVGTLLETSIGCLKI